MAKRGVLVIGSMNFDSFYSLPRRMRIGENLHATSYETALGGKGANQAVQCAKLSLSTTMFGCLGNDNYGNQIYSGMSEYGVDMSYVIRADIPTGNASVWVYPDSEVQAALFGGANMQINCQDIDRVFPLMQQHQIVILQNEIPVDAIEHSVKMAKRAECFVIYNAAPALEVSRQTLEFVDLFVVNESEASFYSQTDIRDLDTAKKGAQQLAPMLKGTLIITLGSLGSMLVSNGAIYHIEAQKVRAVETTGAGDSYVGALAYGIIKGLPIWEAAQIATRAAAITVSSTGAQPSMPTLEQLLRAYGKNL